MIADLEEAQFSADLSMAKWWYHQTNCQGTNQNYGDADSIPRGK